MEEENEQESFPDPIPPDEVLTPDLQVIRELRQKFAPLLKEARADIGKERAPRPFLTSRARRDVAGYVQTKRPELKRLLTQLKGSPVTERELTRILEEGIDRGLKSVERALDPEVDLRPLLSANLEADGLPSLIDHTFRFTSPDGGVVLCDTRAGKEPDVAEIILIVSVVIEVIGILAALAGVILPKINVAAIAKALGARMTSPSARRSLIALLKVLRDAGKGAAEKLQAIFKYLQYIANAGVLSDILAQILHDLSWWRIGLLIAQLLAQIAAWFLPGAQAALITQKAIAVAAAVAALASKARDLGDMLKGDGLG
jgi:hypothetical protein